MTNSSLKHFELSGFARIFNFALYLTKSVMLLLHGTAIEVPNKPSQSEVVVAKHILLSR